MLANGIHFLLCSQTFDNAVQFRAKSAGGYASVDHMHSNHWRSAGLAELAAQRAATKERSRSIDKCGESRSEWSAS